WSPRSTSARSSLTFSRLGFQPLDKVFHFRARRSGRGSDDEVGARRIGGGLEGRDERLLREQILHQRAAAECHAVTRDGRGNVLLEARERKRGGRPQVRDAGDLEPGLPVQ